MRDPITDAAQDPSCLLCLTPDRGGSWWSRLRPAMPRDFSEGYRWDALQAAMYSSLPWTNDYHFTFDFTVADDFENGSYWIMYQSNGRISFALDKDARGCRFVFGSYSFNGGVFVYAPFASSLAGRHEVTLAVEGATLRVTVDGTVYEQSGERVESSAYNRVVTTSAPVTLHAVSLTDDSTGTAVWQAAYSDLNDTSNPWPSPVPRNFAEEPEAWRDEETTAPSIGEDDCEFFIRYRLDGYPEGSAISQIFYHNSQNGSINIAFAGDGTGGNYSVIRLTDTDGVVIPLDRIRQLGEHTIRIQRVGLFVTVEFDGEVVATSSAGTKKIAVYSTTAPVSDFDGVIFETYWKSLTTGRTVWSYPSEAERVRLITKTNVRTDRGVFEAADDANIAGIATPLDFRGNTKSKTFIVRAFCPAHDPASEKLYIHPFFGQGLVSGSSSQYTFQFSLWEDRRAGYNIHLRSVVSAGTPVYEANVRNAELYLEQWHTYVMVVDYRGDNCYIHTFVDGTMIAERTISGTPVWNTPAATTTQETTVGIRRDPNSSYYAGSLTRISAALIFDRALTAAEIAALSPRREWVFEVEAGSISITTQGFQNLKWTLPDGSTSTAANLTGNVTAGTVICRYSGMGSYSGLIIKADSSNPAMLNTVLNINNLPPVTASLRITGVAGLAGNAVDLPRVTTSLYLVSIDGFYADAADLPRPGGILLLQNCPNITGSFADLAQSLDSFYCTGTGLTGTTADIPRATNVLHLASIAGLTGDVADLPLNSGVRSVVFCAGITGALPVTATNTSVTYHRNSSVTPAEYDQTVQNVVDAGAINGTLTISKNRTSASDANIQLLRDRGWTVAET